MLAISSAEWEVMRVLWAKGQATSSEIIEILAKICLTKHSDLLGQLIAKTPMTQADVDKLQALLLAKAPVDQVVCDCVPGQCACGHHMEVN